MKNIKYLYEKSDELGVHMKKGLPKEVWINSVTEDNMDKVGVNSGMTDSMHIVCMLIPYISIRPT